MLFIPEAESLPLTEDVDGAVRVGGTRVLLELVVRAFQDGATPEAIVQRYDTLRLADVYGVISHYLRHQADVDQYLAGRERQAAETQHQIAMQQQGDMSGMRARLLANRTPTSA